MTGDADHGYFVCETRLLSRWRYLIDDEAPSPNAQSSVQQNRWLGYYVIAAPGVTRPPADEGSGQVPYSSQITLELRVTRTIDGGVHEDLDFTNYTQERTTFKFTIVISPLPATRGEGRVRGNLDRFIEISAPNATITDTHLTYQITLNPGDHWHTCIRITATIDGHHYEAPNSCTPDPSPAVSTSFEHAQSATLTTDVLTTLEQARADLAALRLPDLDRGDAWTVAAGLPQYVALFGRDSLTAGWQSAILGPEMMRGALTVLAELQGTRVDDWRDEQPGKMLHEAHTDPRSAMNLTPRGRSYGSITTSGLYAFIAAELWHWTGDKNQVRPFIEPALRALQWLDRDGDLDGDGFYEYKTRSPMGPIHQAWKDSPDAIVYEDGTLVAPPIATCEEQAFVYAAKLHLSETMWWLGEHDLAKRLYREASELKKRFHDAFWMEDEGFYALALDADKRQVRSIASNAGHCIAAGIAERSVVPRVADRLFADDLFSGWGIRTLSSHHPRYNPYSYHLGSIWPVEHGTFAMGFMRFGLFDHVERIARAQFEAASLFEFHRLPELFGGHPRDAQHPFPAIYPNASAPQAWSASSVFMLLQALLGLYPYAPLRILAIDPHLPEWLPEITLRDLRVGEARVTIHFQRRRDGSTAHRVLAREGTLRVVRVRDALLEFIGGGPPWS
jgi:glycogen debranching enzyme